jgi:hypothetical protein
MRNQYLHTGLILLPIIVMFALLGGCNTRPTRPDLNPDYTLQGAMVVDQNRSAVAATAEFWRNDSLLASADLSIGTHQLVYSMDTQIGRSIFRFTDIDVPQYLGDTIDLSVVDGDLLDAVESFRIPGDFSVSLVNPPNHLIQGNGNATISWTGAPGAQAYIMTAVKANQAYSGTGYTVYSLSGTGGTIPPDAFLIPGTTEVDTGLYNLYVYALTGAPDSAQAGARLPVPLPIQQADNLSLGQLTGRFGAVLIAAHDTVRVAVQQ